MLVNSVHKSARLEVIINGSRIDTLKVPGATLHYEVRGTGPVLLLIPGGPADAGAFGPIRAGLSDRYTGVTYDPRGLSRSPFRRPRRVQQPPGAFAERLYEVLGGR